MAKFNYALKIISCVYVLEVQTAMARYCGQKYYLLKTNAFV